MSNQKIYLVCGFHVNFYHSWRGDRNDRTGFGIDSQVIQGVLNIMDEANASGKAAGGTWDFDNYWSLENIMPRFAPEVLEGIVRRVRDGRDEAILGCWNNGDVGASTIEEFRENLRRTISNPHSSGVKDIFGSFSPVIRTQETMFTQGSIEMYREQGVEAIGLYYSSVPFDAIRNFVPRLSHNQMFNTLRLKSTESDAEMLMIPMYNQGDIVAKGSLRRWVTEIRRRQLSGEIPGNALIYINMDADGEIWTGIPLPKIFERLPHVRGLREFIDLVDEFEFLEFGNLGAYIKENEPAGELIVRQDLADGSYTGYNSWTEKEVNQRLWRLSERARQQERAADFISNSDGFKPDTRREIRDLLYDAPDSCFESKLLLLSTTHFGMNSPAIHEDRARVAFNLARNAVDTSAAALQKALDTLPVQDTSDLEFRFSVLNQPKYRNQERVASGLRVLMRVPFEFPAPPCKPEKLSLMDTSGNPATFDLLEYDCDSAGHVKSGVICFIHTTSEARIENYTLMRSDSGNPTCGAGITAHKNELGNGIVHVKLDDLGRIVSFTSGGAEFAAEKFLSLGATYLVDKQRKHFSPRIYQVEEAAAGPLGNLGRIRLLTQIVIFSKGKNYTIKAEYDLLVFAGLPYLFLDADVSFPLTPAETDDVSVSSRLSQKFDTRWFEVMPAEIRPAIASLPGKFLRVWKHNYKNVTNYYDFDYSLHDWRNRNIDSCNNHVTDGWVAVSNTEKGLLISSDARVNSSPAYCPMRLRERDGAQRIFLNPFGSYFGKQFTHHNEGFSLAAEFVRIVGAQFRPTAPSFNGRRVRFRSILAPYTGDGPDAALQAEAGLFSLPPVVFRSHNGKNTVVHDFPYQEDLDTAVAEHGLDSCKGWSYGDFLTDRNKDLPPGVPKEKQTTPITAFFKIISDGIKMRP